MRSLIFAFVFVHAVFVHEASFGQEQLVGIGSANNGPIFQVNQSTGEDTANGLLGRGVGDLASDVERLWGIDRSSLLQLDPNNAGVISEVLIDSNEIFRTLAINPIDGRFFATSSDSFSSSSPTQLHEIQPQTGEVSLIGELDRSYDGLAFDRSGELFGLSRNLLATIDLVTAEETTVIAALGLRSGFGDIAFRKSDNALFAAANSSEGYALARIDIDTGTTEIVGPSVFRPSGLAFVMVPEPTGGIVLALGCSVIIWKRSR